MPSAYIISYSRDLVRSDDAHAQRQLERAIPPGIFYLGTLECWAWRPPPPQICNQYSGVSSIVKQYVMRDPRAVRAVDMTVARIMAAFRRGHGEVVMGTMCLLGTHRSVAVAEVVGQRLERLGVRVHVRHPHRRRKIGDAY